MNRLPALPALALVGACTFTQAPAELAAPDSTRQRAALHTELALAYLAQERPDVARTEAWRALAARPDDGQALHALALAEAAVGDTSAARRHFESALAARPDDIVLLKNFGAVLCDSGETVRGASLLRHAAELQPAPGKKRASDVQCVPVATRARIDAHADLPAYKQEYIAATSLFSKNKQPMHENEQGKLG